MYIGKKPQIGNYQACDSISATATDTFNLLVGGVAVSPISAHHCLVSLNGILQAPISSYTIVGSTIVFASALTTSDSIDFITILGNTLDTGTPSDGTVTTAKLASTVLTGATDVGAAIADADLFLLDDGAGGTLRKTAASRIKTYAGGANTPSFFATLSGDQTLADTTTTKITFDTELYDSDGTFASYKWTPATAGKYYIFAGLHWNVDYTTLWIYKNGSALQSYRQNRDANRENSMSISTIDTADADDYYEVFGYQASGGNLATEAGERRSHFGGFKIIT